MIIDPSPNDRRRLLGQLGLISDRAGKALQKRLEQDPGNGALWCKYGDFCRASGDVDKALIAYRKMRELGHQTGLAQYFMELFELDEISKPLDFTETEFLPVPFIRQCDFLEPDQVEQVWRAFDRNQPEFVDSGIGQPYNEKINKDHRKSRLLNGHQFEELSVLFEASLMPVLNRAYRQFGICAPENPRLTMQMTSHAHDDFFNVHRDSGDKYARLLSYVYYFHTKPRRFRGGELYLYDTNREKDSYNSRFTLIEPEHNSLVVFPSEYFHQVCTVHLDADNRRDGRNSINGWHLDWDLQKKIRRAAWEAREEIETDVDIEST